MLNLTGLTTLVGLALVTGIALLAKSLQQLPGLGLFSPLILAVLLGILVKNTVGVPKICQSGITFSLKRVLRLAIILMGLQLSLLQLIQVGPVGLMIVAATVGSTFVFTCWLGHQLGVSRKLAHLIAAGTSICGASAVVATNTLVEGQDEDVAYAITIVTVFGTISMLLYPLLSTMLQLTPAAFGVWSGTSIHEVAQVVAAAFQQGDVSGELATVAKLARMLFLVPIMLMLRAISMRSGPMPSDLSHRLLSHSFKSRQLPVPWFILGFVALIGLNSLDLFSPALKDGLIQGNKFLLTISLAAMGLETDLLKMKQTGLKPLYLGGAAWCFISLLSLGLIKAFY
ncbi:MAG: YeiH family protein [Cyanobacteria bacterium P01_H01_bin.105]